MRASDEADTPESTGVPPDPLDILVVDDDVSNLLAIEAALGDLDRRLVKATSGPEALRRILEQDFALILLDVHMPSMDGFETARLIRGRPRNRHVPIIFVTAYDQTDARVLEGYSLGAVDFLFKPIVQEVLRAKATVFVQLHERTAELARQGAELRRAERRQAVQELREERRRWEQETLRRQMTEQQQMTEDLARKAAELARSVAEREAAQRELSRLLEQLEETDRRKDEFLATLAHELRNPLAPLVYAMGLLEQIEDPVLRGVCVRMQRQLDHLRRLVDDLLDISRVTSGKIELKTSSLDLREAIQHAVEVSRPLIDERGHRFSVELGSEPLTVNGDAVRLSQVMANLLNNAARYTEKQGEIRVSAWADGREAVVEVRDDGVGIAPEMIDRIFDPFVQVRIGGGGLGLGLHLVSHLLQLHGGRVHALSEGLGRGTSMIVAIPLALPLETAFEPPSGHFTPTGERLSIVVVEDNDDVRDMVSLLLSHWGHRVTAVANGAEGVSMVSQLRPDIALVDIGLPDIDGLTVAATLRELLGDDCPTLIAVSGWGQDEDRRRALAAGFARHLAKPVTARALQRVLSETVPRRGARGPDAERDGDETTAPPAGESAEEDRERCRTREQ